MAQRRKASDERGGWWRRYDSAGVQASSGQGGRDEGPNSLTLAVRMGAKLLMTGGDVT